MENQTNSNERSTFLTVICILSFIGLGLSIIQNLFSLAFSQLGDQLYTLLQNSFETALNQMQSESPEAVGLVEKIFETVLKLIDVLPVFLIISIILSGIALAGAITMWNLKKTGFYLYTGAKVVMIFVPVMLIGLNFVTFLMAFGTFFTAAIFITLYALNLKAMK